MSFLDIADRYQNFDFDGYFAGVGPRDVETSLSKAGEINRLDEYDLLNLLSPGARDFLEPMAQKARALTLQYFGRTIGLYAPMYISDYCANLCTYCGFNSKIGFRRTKLSLEEIETEARAIAALGFRHILVLTGEAPAKTPMDYLESAVSLLTRHFASVALEIFPMEAGDYGRLVRAGADSLTVYQETYDRNLYKEVHLKGPKSNYEFRLLTPERGARAGFRALTLGPLFGLGEPRAEGFLAGIHAKFLEREFPDVEVSLSLPRMNPVDGGMAPRHLLDDTGFVQTMLAWRLFMPRLGINISTRESARFRDRLIHLGATRYSAGSKTDVGGYTVRNPDNTDTETTVQFDITDGRSVGEVCQMIRDSGYQPVFKDWEIFLMMIGIAGAGGIGSNVARHLVQSGITRLRVVDFDRVEPSNLDRQFYFMDQVGRTKVDCLKENLERLCPRVHVETMDMKIGPGQSPDIFKGCSLVVEGFDDPSAKKDLVEKMAGAGIPVVSASGIAGRDMAGIRTRKLGNCWIVGDFASDVAGLPLFPPKVALIAAMMAGIAMALKGDNNASEK